MYHMISSVNKCNKILNRVLKALHNIQESILKISNIFTLVILHVRISSVQTINIFNIKITSSHGNTLQYVLCTFDGWIII